MAVYGFGEVVEGYETRVLNEREARASAGILFAFAIVSFMNAWLAGNFVPTKIFVAFFLAEFFVRLLISPRFAPSLIVARWIVNNQKPEYVGAPQKRWAWAIGLGLAAAMFVLIVLGDVKGPLNLFVCLACLTLLFFEAAFGICLGCRVYNLFHHTKAQNCPGDACTLTQREVIQKISPLQTGIVVAALALIVAAAFDPAGLFKPKPIPAGIADESCQPPQWAIDMGHGEKWKLHHGCL